MLTKLSLTVWKLLAGIKVHEYPDSICQVLLHPSPFITFPSSHSSFKDDMKTPSPQ